MGKQNREREPALAEILDDPIIRSLMDRDGVKRASLELLIGTTREKRSASETILSSAFW